MTLEMGPRMTRAMDLPMSLKLLAGVRPQSKVAGDCTLAPDPGGCALSEDLSEEGASSEEGERRKEERGTTRNESVMNSRAQGWESLCALCFWVMLYEKAAYLIDEG